ncbi:hypothetical protein D3C73_1210050 [compost metagenome]
MSEPGNFRFDLVTEFEVGAGDETNTCRRSCEQEVARFESEMLGYRGNLLRNRPDHFTRVGVLFELTIHP